MNAKPTRLIEVQGKLRDLTGNEDLCLKVSAQKKSITVFSEEDNNKQYGYIFLDFSGQFLKFHNSNHHQKF